MLVNTGILVSHKNTLCIVQIVKQSIFLLKVATDIPVPTISSNQGPHEIVILHVCSKNKKLSPVAMAVPRKI